MIDNNDKDTRLPVPLKLEPISRNPGSSDISRFEESESHSMSGALSRSLLNIILRRRKLIVGTVVAFVLITVLYLLKATPQYMSTSRVCVEQSGPKILTNSDMGITESKNYLNTQVEIVKSPPIISEAIRQFNLKDLKCFADVDNISYELKEDLNVTVGKNNDILTISYETPYPKESAKVVNSVVRAYIDCASQKKHSISQKIKSILTKELNARETELVEKRKELATYRRENELLGFGTDKKSTIIERLLHLSDAVTEAEMKKIAARAAYEPLLDLTKKQKDIIKLINMEHGFPKESPAYDEIKSIQDELVKLELQREELLQSCTASHPSIQAIQKRMNYMANRRNTKIYEVVNAQLERLRQNYISAMQRHRELVLLLEKQKELAKELNSKTAKYAMLESEVSRIEQICDRVYTQIKGIYVAADAGSLNIQVLETAEPADRPSSPKKLKALAGSIVMGLIIGILLAMVREWMDHRLRSADEVSPLLGVGVIGVLPKIDSKELESPSQAGRILELQPASLTSEAFRTIRTAALLGLLNGEKSLLITSPEPGEGKSFVCSNLALALAQAGHKVLLLELDLRKPVQKHTYELQQGQYDLYSILAGECEVEQAIRHHHEDSETAMDILPCLQHLPNPSETIGSTAFKQLLQNLTERYDKVLIDSPPVLPVADSRILASMADATILVLRANKSGRKHSEHAVRILKSSGARILGVVMNDITIHKSSSYGYSYSYGYGDNYKGSESAGRSKKKTKKLESGSKVNGM